MPKSKSELAKYSRDWRKKTSEQANFNKIVRGYVETKHKNVMNECEQFYRHLVQIHQYAKDLLKTKTYKLWKKEQLTLPQPSEEITPPQPSEEITPPQPSEEITPPQPSEEITPPQPSEEITPPQPSEEITPPQPSEEITPPQPSEEITPPQPSEEITPPQPSEEITLPQQNVLTQVISELNIDQLSEQVQDLIEDLQQDPEVRDLLNDQELFPPLQEDEGIDLDIEVEIGDLYDPLTEEPFW